MSQQRHFAGKNIVNLSKLQCMTSILMKNKVCFRRLIKLKYNTTDKNLIVTGYTNFLTQFSVSLNNLVRAYITIIVTIIIII